MFVIAETMFKEGEKKKFRVYKGPCCNLIGSSLK